MKHEHDIRVTISIPQLAEISKLFSNNFSIIIQNQNKIMKTLDEILTGVTEEGTQIDSLVTLTAGIKAQLDEVLSGVLTPEQQAKVDAIFEAVEANKQKVVTAINANDSDPNT